MLIPAETPQAPGNPQTPDSPQTQGKPQTPDSPEIHIVEETTSTNDVAKERARAGAPHGYTFCAHRQSAGRGRRGHSWDSSRETFCFSIILRPGVPMAVFNALPFVSTLGVIRALRSLPGLARRVALKWPNDLIVIDTDKPGLVGATDGRKLGGMLVEAGSSAAGLYAVAGQGINLWRSSTPVHGTIQSQDLPHPLGPVCLEDLLGADNVPGFEELACLLQQHILETVDSWSARIAEPGAELGALQAPLQSVLPELYDAVPALGHPVSVYLPSGVEQGRGTFAGIDGQGRAVIVYATGEQQSFAPEQISLRCAQ